MMMKHRITVQPVPAFSANANNGSTARYQQETPTLFRGNNSNTSRIRTKTKTKNLFHRIFCSGTNKYDPIIVAIVVTFVLTTFFVTLAMTLLLTNTMASSRRRHDTRRMKESSQGDNGITSFSKDSSSSYFSVHSLFNLFPSSLMHQHQKIKEDDEDEEESGDENERYKILPYNSLYKIPDSFDRVGDRSNRYIQLRYEYDTRVLPINYTRSVEIVRQMQVEQQQKQQSMMNAIPTDDGAGRNSILANHRDAWLQPVPVTVHHSDTIPYDIYNCPETPPAGYPFQWNMMDVLNNWTPDNVTLPTSNSIYQGLCVFDYTTDYEKAISYREAELPFVVVNDPDVARTVERWNSPGYMERMLGNVQHRTEYSENNHFMYYQPPSRSKGGRRRLFRADSKHHQNRVGTPVGWKQPTKPMRMTYNEWLSHANSSSNEFLTPDQPHWYFRLIGCGYMGTDGSCDRGSSEYLYDELPFFQPKESLYVVEPYEQKGIHCRFGMKGVIAENHYDGSRNSIVVLTGTRRYILAHPNQCSKLALYPKGHPSFRHSAVDWSNPNLDEYPEFAEATANEVVLQPGQVLYLPTDWFHYIVSLELNFQCNTRSGITDHYKEDLRSCGF